MATEWTAIRLIAVFSVSVLLQQIANAHGGVVEEDDLCVIKVSYLRAHFKVYQPRETGHRQYCEDLPAASESVFVMEYLHHALASMPINFRIIRDVTGKGRFARPEDVVQIEDLDAVTVFYQPAVIEPDVFTVIHDFADEGDFIGIVSATQPDTGVVHAAVFPFEVGYSGMGYWPLFIGLLVLLQLQYLLMSGRLKRWFSRRGSTATVALWFFLLSVHADPVYSSGPTFNVTYSTPSGPPTINRIHSWIVHIESAEGMPVENAEITVTGGMPEHDHGLPTVPRVTRELGGGDYVLDGMRFHMRGRWEIELTISTEQGSTVVIIPLQL